MSRNMSETDSTKNHSSHEVSNKPAIPESSFAKSHLKYLGIILLFHILFFAASQFTPSGETLLTPGQIVQMFLTSLFGMFGASIRMLSEAHSEPPGQRRKAMFDNRRLLVLGGFMGMMTFLIIESKILPALMYDDLPLNEGSPSRTGVLVIAALVGLFPFRFLRAASAATKLPQRKPSST